MNLRAESSWFWFWKVKENSAASHFLQSNPVKKKKNLILNWRKEEDWPSGQDILDIDFEEQVLKEKKELRTLFFCKSSLGYRRTGN